MLSGGDLVRIEGVGAMDNQNAKKLEAIARGGGWGEAGPNGIEDGVGSCTSTRNLLESAKSSNIGISAFSFGLQRCDFAEL